MEVMCSSETSVDFQRTIWPYIPEDVLFVLYLHLPGETGKSLTLQPGYVIPMKDMTQVPLPCECTTKLLKSNVYNCQSQSICLTLFLPNCTPQEILVTKDAPLGEMIPGKLLILLLRV
jgi:hypothetical protein